MRAIIFLSWGKNMRCPKCGYISFDHLENCKKCNKIFRDVASDLHGTAYDSAAPLFLQLAARVRNEEQVRGAAMAAQAPLDDQEESVMGGRQALNEEFALDDLSFDEQPELEEIDVAQDGPVFRLSLENDNAFSLQDDEGTPGAFAPDRAGRLPTMDFGNLDISDLAPPALEGAIEGLESNEGPDLVHEREPAFVSATTTAPANASRLEDLQFNDLNLGRTDRMTTNETTGRHLTRPPITGTALDNFQVDLSEFFEETKK
ncbi:MAG: hypothetical protein RBT36_07850 [Desulfobulbus sp.]|nr:hypothetical protein [Desulfobulbus sp.]